MKLCWEKEKADSCKHSIQRRGLSHAGEGPPSSSHQAPWSSCSPLQSSTRWAPPLHLRPRPPDRGHLHCGSLQPSWAHSRILRPAPSRFAGLWAPARAPQFICVQGFSGREEPRHVWRDQSLYLLLFSHSSWPVYFSFSFLFWGRISTSPP